MAVTIETGTEDLLGRVEGNVAVLTFNRPHRRNALTGDMYLGFDAALKAIANDASVRAVMITGAGGAFCAGGDVKAMNDSNQSGQPRDGQPDGTDARLAYLRERQEMVSLAIHRLPKPVIAALPGPAAGAGLSIALSADLRVAAPNAFVVTAFAGVGASGDFGGSWFLTHLIGAAKAKELYFRSPRIDATEAHRLGIVNTILDADDFEAAAIDYCQQIADQAPLAIARMKENIDRAGHVDLREALHEEAANMVFTMGTADHREAAAAFVEKRSATFIGE